MQRRRPVGKNSLSGFRVAESSAIASSSRSSRYVSMVQEGSPTGTTVVVHVCLFAAVIDCGYCSILLQLLLLLLGHWDSVSVCCTFLV